MLQAISATERPLNLNERITHACRELDENLNAIEALLGRVNGTPAAPVPVGGGNTPAAPIQPLECNVALLEAYAKRLSELSRGLQQIA